MAQINRLTKGHSNMHKKVVLGKVGTANAKDDAKNGGKNGGKNASSSSASFEVDDLFADDDGSANDANAKRIAELERIIEGALRAGAITMPGGGGSSSSSSSAMSSAAQAAPAVVAAPAPAANAMKGKKGKGGVNKEEVDKDHDAAAQGEAGDVESEGEEDEAADPKTPPKTRPKIKMISNKKKAMKRR